MKQENAFWTKEVADILQIAESTLRKWCIQLEKNDYTFTKGTNGSRIRRTRLGESETAKRPYSVEGDDG
ncbi:hypothetical protein EWI07_07050 [Sporolactobacillus sp. THM7-4]|nr:hypothetical protein EWI07_07050 [Sporolactobacillus sp. THM7-4]